MLTAFSLPLAGPSAPAKIHLFLLIPYARLHSRHDANQSVYRSLFAPTLCPRGPEFVQRFNLRSVAHYSEALQLDPRRLAPIRGVEKDLFRFLAQLSHREFFVPRLVDRAGLLGFGLQATPCHLIS